jgi:hypothetical protein
MSDSLIVVLTFAILSVVAVIAWAILDLSDRRKKRRLDREFQREVDALLKEEK